MFKPMLAGKANIDTVRFPVLVSPKLDGVRAIVYKGQIVSRNLKPIPNKHVQKLFSSLEGLDGELIVGDPTTPSCFRDTTSGVMSHDGEPDVYFYAFDVITHPLKNFTERYSTIDYYSIRNSRVIRVPHHVVTCKDTLLSLEEEYLSRGYEGVMLRSAHSPYKFGRSTEREGWLLKLKRFEDSEAVIVDIEELMHNANEATINALGRTERSSHKENKVPAGRMGNLIVRDVVTGVLFGIGTGFDDAQRNDFWNNKEQYIHQTVKYKYFPTGSKDKPRFPTFLGMSNEGKEP